MHFALLIGYGASAINPYLAIETIHDLKRRGLLPDKVTAEYAEKNFIKAINKGLLKTFSKMGISTLQSYRGAQVFEAVGLNKALIDAYFTGTASRIEGVGLDVLAREAQMKHAYAFQPLTESKPNWSVGGSINIARAASITCSIRSPSASCSTPCGRTTRPRSRNTPT
jgi:glutamate synthase (NADPH) large chain